MCSEIFRNGIIQSVISNYGEIQFDDDSTSKEAFFDLESVGNALDDLTVYFKKGMKVKANTKEGENGDVNGRLKAYSVMKVDSIDPTIRGGDEYLKKLFEGMGPQTLDSLPQILMGRTDNCPKFLKSGKIDGIKKVVLSRPDWFKITIDFYIIVIPFEKSTQKTLLSILKKQNSISIDDFENTFSQYKKANNGYLTASNLIDFVSRHADSFIFWKNSLWTSKSLFEDNEDSKQFCNDIMALKYYSQFIPKDAKVNINVLRGHYSQATKLVQQAVKSKDPDFRLLWKRNKYFFNFEEDDTLSCYFHRLPELDLYLSKQDEKTHTMTLPSVGLSDATTLSKTPISKSDPAYLFSLNNQQMEGEDWVKEEYKLNDTANLVDFIPADKCDEGDRSESTKQVDAGELKTMTKSSSVFSVKDNHFRNIQEEGAVEKICDFLTSSPLTVADLKLKLESYPETARYLFDGTSETSMHDIVSRNPDLFVFWRNSIYLCKQIFEDLDKKECFEAEMRAIKYYARFIKKNSPTQIVSVRGHYAQATPEIRNVAHSRPQDFLQFLNRNAFFFEVSCDCVKMAEKHCQNLMLIEKWLDTNFQKKALLPEKSPSIHESETGQVNVSSSNSKFRISEDSNDRTPFADSQDRVGFPIQESRAFIEDSPSKIPLLVAEAPLLHANDEILKNDTLLQHSILNERSKMQGSGVDETLQRILGIELSDALWKQLPLQNVNNLILLRLHVGTPTKAIFWDVDSKSWIKDTVGSEVVKQLDVNRVLRSPDVIKLTDGQHYGIRGTLHTINVMKENETVHEVTIFYQVHEYSDGLMLDMEKGQCLQAVYPGQYPDKWIYNYLRSKSKELSKSKDLLILDMYGKVTGCDDEPHASSGDVIRILCTEADLVTKILDAIPRKQQYVIIIGVDTKEQFEAVEKMCRKGIEVIAEVSKSLKSHVKQLLQ